MNEDLINKAHELLAMVVEKHKAGEYQLLIDLAEAVDKFPQMEECFESDLYKASRELVKDMVFVGEMLDAINKEVVE